MDVFRTVSLGDSIYKLGTYFFLFPKTFYKVISAPHWIPDYVETELEKQPGNRFDSHVPPALFWLVLGVASYFISLEIIVQGFSEGVIVEAFNQIDDWKIIIGFVFIFIPIPLSFAFVLHLLKYRAIETSSFKRSFYIQSYCTAPLQLSYLFGFFVVEGDSPVNLLGLIALIGIAWFIYCQASIIRKELNAGLPKIIGVLLLMWISFWVYTAIGLGLFFALNIRSIRMLMDALLTS